MIVETYCSFGSMKASAIIASVCSKVRAVKRNLGYGGNSLSSAATL
jgi:hypothetical protein